MSHENFVAGDTASVLEFNLIDAESKEPIDLTGCTVTLRIRFEDNSLLEQEMEIVDADAGQVRYQFQTDELIVGRHQAEAVIAGPDGELTTRKVQSIVVRDRI